MLRKPPPERTGRESDLFRLLAENVLDYAIFLVDPAGRIQSWNGGAERLFGYRDGEILGNSADLLFTPEDIDAGEPRREIEQARAPGCGDDDRWYVRKDGTRIWCSGTLTPLLDAAGELHGYAKIMRDRTGWKRQEEERERRRWIDSLLIESGSALTSSLDYKETVARVVRLCVPTLAEWAILDLVGEEGNARRVEVAHADADDAHLAARLKRFAPRWDTPHQPSIAVMLSGRSTVVSVVTDEIIRTAAQSPEHEAVLREIDPQTAFIVPLIVASQRLGLLTLLRTGRLPVFSGEDRLAVEELAQRAAMALFNARLYREVETEHAIVHSVTSNAATGIFMTNAEGVCTFMNPAAAEMIGHSLEDLKGERLLERIARYDPTRTITQSGPVRLDRYRYEDEFHRKDGSRFPVRCWASSILKGEIPAGTVIEAHDITGEKKARQQIVRLLTQEQTRAGKLQRLAAASLRIHSAMSLENVLHAITSEAQQLIEVHQVLSTLLEDGDRSRRITSTYLSQKYTRWSGLADRHELTELEMLVCESNQSARFAAEELAKRPEWRQLIEENTDHLPLRGWLAAPFVNRDGRNLGLIQLSNKIAGDFTGDDEAILMQLAAIASVALENARLYEILRDADRRKDEFLAMLAHELRNPLAPIRTGLDLFSMGEQDEEIVELMQHQVEHLVQLVDDLLDVSRIMRGKIDLRKRPIELNSVLSRAVEAARPLIEAHGHKLVLEVCSDPVPLLADLVRLTQVISNLLTNAAKYTENGGTIWLQCRTEGDTAIVTVRDTGMGIDSDLLPHVFDLFRQADRSIDRSEGGLGIGLTIVKSLVEMHGGTVTAASEGPGRGSEFSLLLPVMREAEQPKDDEQLPGHVCRGLRILIVDDNVSAVKVLSRLLEKLGQHSVMVAHDGRQAVEIAERETPDIVLLDIGLPEMSGYDVARKLRQNPSLAGTQLIALTGYGTEEDRRRSREAGFDDHLVKPPSVELLQQLFARFPARSGHSSECREGNSIE